MHALFRNINVEESKVGARTFTEVKMYCISFPRDFSYIKQQVSPASDTNSIEGNNTSGKQGTTLTAARKQKQRAIISIFFCQFHSGELRGKLNEKVHFLMDRGSTPPPAPPLPSSENLEQTHSDWCGVWPSQVCWQSTY